MSFKFPQIGYTGGAGLLAAAIACGLAQPALGQLIAENHMPADADLAALMAVSTIAPVSSAAISSVTVPEVAASLRVVAADLPLAPSAVARLSQQAGSSSGVAGAPVDVPTRDHSIPGALPLSIDDAIALGVKNNTQLTVQALQERIVAGQILSVGNALLPNITASAYTRTQEINLVALGFKPSSIKIPGIVIPEIVKVNTTNAQLSLSQALFNVPAYYLYRAAQKAGSAAGWATLNVRGSVVLNVGSQYLRALADQAQIANAKALIVQDQDVLRHAQESQAAGVGVHIDVLRAQVQLQQEQQILIADENAFEKDKIQLNRVMGIAADQSLTLTDAVPFAVLDELSLDDARTLAYTRRKDLLSLLAQEDVSKETARAVRYQYLPTLGVNGYYGVLGQTTGSYHGDFAATGSLNFPIFNEGQLRGEREVAAAQSTALKQQVAGLKIQIEADIRAGMLDVESSSELVKAARTNVTLAQQELSDATLRFTAGVDDSLPVVRAQASLAGAQAQVIQSEFQYNQAKLELARRTGVVETEYKHYLGR